MKYTRGNTYRVGHMFRSIIFILTLLSPVCFLFAKTNSTPDKSNTLKLKKIRPLGLSVSAEWGSNLLKEHDGTTAQDGSITFKPSYKLSKNYTLSAQASLAHEKFGEQKTYLSNTKVGLSHKAYKLGSISITPALSVTLPTNKDARDEATYLGSLAGGLLLSTKIMGLNLSYLTKYQQNQHTYTQNSGGGFNTYNTFIQNTGISKDFIDNFSFDFSFTYIMAWDYNGLQTNNFGASESISYQINKKTSLSLGHSNSAPALKVDGASSNIKLFDEKTSRIFTSINIKI